MKKTALLSGLLLGASLLLVGCQSQSQNQTANSSSTKTAKVQKKAVKKASSVSNQTTSASSSSASSSSASTSSNTDSSSLASNNARFQAFNQQLTAKLGNVLLPRLTGLTGDPGYLNVSYQGNTANFTVKYIVSYTPHNLNDSGLTKQIPYAEFSKKTYNTSQEAQNALNNYREASNDQGLPSVTLTNNIKGYLNSGAGQRYLHWNEGNWSMTVHASVVNGEDPLTPAQTIAGLLENHYLPAPQSIGTGYFEANPTTQTLGQTLTWQKDNVVYTLKAHSAYTGIIMAESIK